MTLLFEHNHVGLNNYVVKKGLRLLLFFVERKMKEKLHNISIWSILPLITKIRVVMIMKKVFTMAMAGVLSVSMLFIGVAEASVSEVSSVAIKKEFLKEQLLENIKVEYPNAQFIDLTDEELQKQEEVNQGIRASAPPLRSLEVYAAISTQHQSYEYFNPNELSSVYDHGGDELYVVTEELGYGHIRYATFDGVNLSQYMKEHIDLNGDNIVDGWYIWWDASGNDNGQFTYQNTSTNFPGNTMFDSIFIK